MKNNKITKLARQAIVKYISQGEQLKVNLAELPEILHKSAGVFVTIKKANKLRGCMGTFKPVQENAAEEIVSNAITAAENDPRFPALEKEELSEITVSVDLLSAAELVTEQAELDPGKYGVLVKGGHQSGLLLPDLSGINSVEEQLKVAKRKAGLTEEAVVEIYRFTVQRFSEDE
ncbi:AmmeMemoRadiSam system protein A [Halanaerobium salsuginis]|jgi:hypothetical protein|uniref:AMMECR1 domain-containing protein n=1 Tax=Halanaerobium salsuginis TaxID=29563 RepID=A0A1I4LI20_9FIRM|nr:AmmeMemoRadiSam system protein A [Halanaerobium salsuginis]SFL90561.1 hypothetical protein SAMN02983006_02318 [Halanaerobium salsuginis]